jgi:hypothetical protein
LFEHIWIGAITLDGTQIQPMANFFQLQSICIDNGNITGFVDEILGNRKTNLTSAQDYYFHFILL